MGVFCISAHIHVAFICLNEKSYAMVKYHEYVYEKICLKGGEKDWFSIKGQLHQNYKNQGIFNVLRLHYSKSAV